MSSDLSMQHSTQEQETVLSSFVSILHISDKSTKLAPHPIIIITQNIEIILPS